MASVFIKVPVSDRLPSESGMYTTNKGAVHFLSGCKRWAGCEPQWFLEEIEIPTEEELHETIDTLEYNENNSLNDEWLNGANFILDKLKGGNNG